MDMLAQWLLVGAAVGIGWALGRWGQGSVEKRGASSRMQVPVGIQFTFENYSDEAIDKYVEALEVERATLPMHLSIASHFRSKGEVNRAILIHQHLLASPRLDTASRERATFELARDYMSAGLFDRAEALLKQLEKSPDWGKESLQLLLEIYQDEKEWGEAKQAALKLDYRRDPITQKRLAHYCCEQADLLLQQGNIVDARRILREALGYDRSCVRVTFTVAQIHMNNGDYASALGVLHRVEDQDVRFLPEVIGPVVECYRKLGQEEKLQQYLGGLLERAHYSRLLIAYADSLRLTQGDRVALSFMADQLGRHISVRGLDYFLQLQILSSPPEERIRLEAIRRLTQKLLETRHPYLCENCGYSGSLLLWQCPSCKSWETIKPVQGIEGH